jgi:DNA polymerase
MGDPELFLAAGGRRGFLDLARESSRGPAEVEDSGVEARLSREGTTEEILALPVMDAVRRVAQACTRCGLHATRNSVVFADGSADARVLCVGEAPGANEDATGLPFVGRAGKLMDRLLLSVGFPRSEVFICNVLKCRPPGNRNPLPEEIESCSPFMLRQVELVCPEVIVAFGTFAAQTLLGTRESLRRLRGRTHLYRGFPLIVTYHPAALLRNPGWTRPTWKDLQRARAIVDGDLDDTPESRGAADTTAASTDAGDAGPPSDQLTLGGHDG